MPPLNKAELLWTFTIDLYLDRRVLNQEAMLDLIERFRLFCELRPAVVDTIADPHRVAREVERAVWEFLAIANFDAIQYAWLGVSRADLAQALSFLSKRFRRCIQAAGEG